MDGSIELPAIKLSEKNKCQCAMDFFRSFDEEIADADSEFAFVQVGRVIDAGKREELHLDLRNGRPRFQFAVRRGENIFKRLARSVELKQ